MLFIVGYFLILQICNEACSDLFFLLLEAWKWSTFFYLIWDDESCKTSWTCFLLTKLLMLGRLWKRKPGKHSLLIHCSMQRYAKVGWSWFLIHRSLIPYEIMNLYVVFFRIRLLQHSGPLLHLVLQNSHSDSLSWISLHCRAYCWQLLWLSTIGWPLATFWYLLVCLVYNRWFLSIYVTIITLCQHIWICIFQTGALIHQS